MAVLDAIESRIEPMATPQEPGTKTVRIDAELAKMLQTISALADQMGERFKPVEFLNGLLRKPITSLFEDVTNRFADFQKRKRKRV